ncbi:Mitotic spindle assembly checkpoint protein MAD1 [Ascosphaera acerosa]|nr:Mitotic spindle assembly checkpoint protein MAD1 [Ascosphaera acerosa]
MENGRPASSPSPSSPDSSDSDARSTSTGSSSSSSSEDASSSSSSSSPPGQTLMAAASRTPARLRMSTNPHAPARESPLRMSMLAPESPQEAAAAAPAQPSTPASSTATPRRSLSRQQQQQQQQQQEQQQQSRLAVAVKPQADLGNEELRVTIATLQYELENLRQERELTALEHERELRELRVRADADFRRAQLAEATAHKAQHKAERSAAELQDAQQAQLARDGELQRRLRAAEDENRLLREEVEDFSAQALENERQLKNSLREVEAVRTTLDQALHERETDLAQTKESLRLAQQRLGDAESRVEALEADNIRLKANESDKESSKILQHELAEQLARVKRLEGELAPLRKSSKRVEVVEEEKRSLETQLNLMKDLEAELNNVQIQKQVLEDERRSWALLLDPDNGNTEFDCPEAIAKALVQCRIENATLLERIGKVQEEMVERDEAICSFEAERSTLLEELSRAREAISAARKGSGAATAGAGAGGGESRVKARLERQRALAVKEVEYLRAQLKAVDQEESTISLEQSNGDSSSHFDQQKSEYIAQLEGLLNEHRDEIRKLHEQLTELEQAQAKPAPAPESDQTAAAPLQPAQSTPSSPRGTKRPAEDDDGAMQSGRLAVLTRKNRTFQETLARTEQAQLLLKRELEAARKQLASLQKTARTRVLELKANPTAEHEKVKQVTLTTLKAENRDLLAQLQGKHHHLKVVPVSAMEALKLELKELEKTVAEKEKRMRRLKEIWTAKSSEFREAVASLLGYKLDFLPNGRVRVTSMYHISAALRRRSDSPDKDGSGGGGGGEAESNSIIFDGENGTMKISGGPNSAFALEIGNLIKFWVEERKDIPCFLAAMTLDYYDKSTRALGH